MSKLHSRAEDYWNQPEGVHAELIADQLWDMAPPNRMHQEIVHALALTFGNHITSSGGPCRVYTCPFTVNLFGDDSTFVEPDISVVCNKTKLSDRGCEGAPDFIVEVVSPSNPEHDYVTKLQLYRDAGVKEYWICDVRLKRVLAYRFGTDDVMAFYPFSRSVPSEVFSGLEVDFDQIVSEAAL